METQDPIIETEFSFEIFDKFNSKFEPCKYCKFCDEEKNLFDGQPPWVKSLCYRLARNIGYIYDAQYKNPDLRKKHCKELVYWVHEEVTNKLGYDNIVKYGVIISKLHRAWNEIRESSGDKKDDICVTGDIINKFREENRKKKMNDYCKYYPIINQELGKEDADCRPYYKYLSESSSIHEEIIKGCKDRDNKMYCPPNGNICSNHPPSEFLSKNACKIINDARAIVTREGERTTCEHCARCPAGRDKEEIGSEEDMEYHCAPINGNGTSFDFSDKRVIFLIVFSVWGMFLTLFLFYKKTPLGSWLNNFLRKKRLIRKNFKENEFNEYADDDYNTVDSNVENKRYDLIYNPI